MILSDRDIRELLAGGELVIEPLGDGQIQPASVDLRLADEYLVIDPLATGVLDVAGRPTYRRIKSDRITVQPHSFILGRTVEYVRIPKGYTAFVEGRSSIGRLGLFIENAGWVDPGFEGTITLELYNANAVPIVLRAGMRICQIVIVKLLSEAEKPYSGKYQGQRSVTESRIYEEIGHGGEAPP
ncbi:MAG: dCTP deaminase [Thermoplasmata archaeon]|nr:dCTP deaminase [Thermoplasmata archaeon]